MKTLFTLLASLMLLTATPLMATVIPPSGLVPGSQYQLIFVTSGSVGGYDPISIYDTFANTQAALSPTLPSGVAWHAVVDTLFEPGFDQLVRTYAQDTAPATGLPVYNTAGILVSQSAIPSPHNDIYNWGLANPIVYNQFGVTATPNWFDFQQVVAMTSNQGNYTFGNVEGTTTWFSWLFRIRDRESGPPDPNYIYALSDPITVPIPEPSTLRLLGLALLVTGGSRFLHGRRGAVESRRRAMIGMALLVASVLQATDAVAARTYTVTNLGTLGGTTQAGTRGVAYGINNNELMGGLFR